MGYEVNLANLASGAGASGQYGNLTIAYPGNQIYLRDSRGSNASAQAAIQFNSDGNLYIDSNVNAQSGQASGYIFRSQGNQVMSLNSTGFLTMKSELQLIGATSADGSTGNISSAGPKELFRVGSSRLCTGGIFTIAATRGNYVTSCTYSWTSSHNGGSYGTITQLSSTNYTQHTVYLDIDGGGNAIISINWTGYDPSFPMGYQVSILKMCGSDVSFSNQGTDWSTVASGYGRRISYTSLANGFKAENGAFTGSLSKGSGSFNIPHPLPQLSESHRLVHSFVEGPQADLIYRGQVTLVNGTATVNIDQKAGMTEGTFEALCRDVQCFTSNETGWVPVRGSVTGNILTIESQDSNSTDTISWMVVAERKDPHMYETAWTDSEGRVIVEPSSTPPGPPTPPDQDLTNNI